MSATGAFCAVETTAPSIRAELRMAERRPILARKTLLDVLALLSPLKRLLGKKVNVIEDPIHFVLLRFPFWVRASLVPEQVSILVIASRLHVS
jgi:hypothetical protein